MPTAWVDKETFNTSLLITWSISVADLEILQTRVGSETCQTRLKSDNRFMYSLCVLEPSSRLILK